MTTATLEKVSVNGVKLCPLLAIADEIDISDQRRFLAIHNPCFRVIYSGTDTDKGGKRATYTRKLCDGYDIRCPAHPNYPRV